jgi:hypothetical protein
MAHKIVNGKKVELTERDLELIEIDRLAEEERIAEVGYIDRRIEEYPSIVEQLDKIYHEGVDSWKAEIRAIKEKYPKPE